MTDSDHAARNARKWNRRAETYDERRFNYLRWTQRRLIALLPLQPGQRLLDIGCGTGWAVRRIAALLDQQGQFFGIDLAPKMLAKAAAQSGAFPNAHYERANAEALPFPADTFDLIICTNSFHHYLRPLQALREMRRVLKPSGRLYLGDATADGWFTQTFDALARRREPEHVRFHSTVELQRFFAQAQLQYIAGPPHWPMFKVHIGARRPA